MTIFKLEWTKLFKKKNTKILIGLYSIILMVMTGLYLFGEKNLGLSIYNESQFIKATLSATMAFILPFIALYLSSTNIINDFSNHTIKNLMLLPINKSKLFVGKLMSIQALIGLLLAIQFAFTMIVGFLLDGGFSFGILISLLGQYLGAFIILGLVNLSGVLLGLLLNSSGLTIVVGYVLFIGMKMLSAYSGIIKLISPTTIISNYGNILSGASWTLLLSVVSYYIILFIVSSQLFEKKEVQPCQSE